MKKSYEDIHGKKYNRWLILFVVVLIAFAGTIMQTSLSTALPTLMKSFDISMSTAQTATTYYLLVNGIIVPLSAVFLTRVPTKRLYLILGITQLVGIIMTYFSPNSSWGFFIAGRIITALAVGILSSTMAVIVMNIFSFKELGTAIGLTGLALGLAPAVGPTLTGWILSKSHVIFGLTVSSSWRSMFLPSLLVTALCVVLIPFVMHDVVENHRQKIDFVSVLLSTIGFGFFITGFSNVADKGWGDLSVILPVIIGVVFIGLFAWRQLRMDDPLLDVRLFLNSRFTVATVGTLLVTMAMYGVEMMLPTYLQNVRGMSPLNSGMTLFFGALMMGVMAPIAGNLADKYGVKKLALTGFFILAIGTLPFAFISATTPTLLIKVMYAVRMIGIATALMPLTTAAMTAVAVEHSTHASTINNTARQISSSIAVAVLTSLTQNTTTNALPHHALKIADPLAYGAKSITAAVSGFRVSFIAGLVLAILGFVFVCFIKKQTKSNGVQKEVD